MNLLTHLVLGDTIYRRLAKKKKPSYFAFLYGNVKPDLSKNLIRIPHIENHYLFSVCRESDLLSASSCFSLKDAVMLGQICHFISDFYCQYHRNPTVYHRYFDHLIHELRIGFWVFPWMRKKKILLCRPKETGEKPLDIITAYNREYRKLPDSPYKDLQCAVLASVQMSELILAGTSASIERRQNLRGNEGA